MNKDIYMKRALELAAKAGEATLSNPQVGAIIVKDKKIIGEGYHEVFGEPHAEINAINAAKNPKGATLYVTLEPCSHTGKTPPCTKAIISAGITKVVIASLDPTSKVNGIEELSQAGIEVEYGILESEAKALNPSFHRLKPHITLKIAMSLDGKVAKGRGVQTWLTGSESKKYVHELRAKNDVILVGAGTVLTDDPHLGVRESVGNDPLRVILKGERKLPAHLKIFRDKNVVVLESENLVKVIERLSKDSHESILVEGGPRIFSAFLNQQLCDEIHFIIAPKILGNNSLAFNEDLSLSFHTKSVQQLGQDTLLIATPLWD